MIPYKFSNGRIMARDSKGRFRNYTLSDMGFKGNSAYLICGKCGYGEHEKWIPLLKDGRCPHCGNDEGHKEKEIPLNDKAEKLLEQIDELETKIGKVFVNPMMINTYGGEFRRLQNELERELKVCADNSFTE
jgi:predicted nucleic-acid-binding Zn-ribbon protein